MNDTSICIQVACENIEKGCLALTVLATQKNDLALSQLEIDTIKDNLSAKCLSHALGPQKDPGTRHGDRSAGVVVLLREGRKRKRCGSH
jgi:hypothetical protein